MPITKEQMKVALSELSASGGGSLVRKVVKSTINEGTKVLFIGLGGLGCKSINEIKRVYKNDFEATSNVKFIAVDTDNKDMREYGINSGGMLRDDEMFPIYSTEAKDLLTTRPALVSKYYSPMALAEELAGDGAKATRGIGRVMLSATSKYGALRSTLRTAITGLAGTPATGIVHVVIVAGISGGTGSGTFIDVSYMVRILLKDIKRQIPTFNGYSYGVFYTPDVQQSIPSIGGNEAKWNSVKCNGYASLKDLDYFMNVGSDLENGPTVYSIATQEREYSSSQSIFDRDKVFIVSQTGSHLTCEDIVSSTAAALMNMFKCGFVDENNNNRSQSVLSTLCNSHADLGSWEGLFVAKNADENNPVDVSGNKRCYFPVNMNYNYASFGYNSVYFPRNEMVAYCANKAYIEIIEKRWVKGYQLSQNMIEEVAAKCGLRSSASLFNIIYSTFIGGEDSLRIKPDDKANYPQRLGFEHLGKMQNLDMTLKKAEALPLAKMENIKNSITANGSVIGRLIEDIVNRVKTIVTDNKNFIAEYGPVGALIILSGTADGTRKGILDILNKHIADYQSNLTKLRNETESLKNRMEEEMKRLDADKNPTDAEIETLVNFCFDYSKAKFRELLFAYAFKGICEKVYLQISEINSQTFNIYVPILDAIKEILQKDSDVFQNSYLEHNGNRTTYCMAYDLDGAMARNDLFNRFFEGYIDPGASNAIVNSIIGSIFGIESRKKWQACVEQPGMLAQELRNVFETAIGPLVSGMLEKFMVIVYGDKNAIVNACNGNQQLSIDDINALWNDDALRSNALQSAATKIIDSLTNSTMIKFDIHETASKDFSTSVDVVLMAETPNLNAAIISEMQHRYGASSASFVVAGDRDTHERKTEISMFSLTVPFALPFVSNMKEYAMSYFNAEKTSTAYGRHLDEVGEKWQDTLPEIYGVDAEDYYAGAWHRTNYGISDSFRATNPDGTVKNTDKQVYATIRDAVEYGIKYGYIDADTGSMIVLKAAVRNEETLRAIQTKLLELNQKDIHNKYTWIDAAKALSAGQMDYFEVINLTDGIRNDPLKQRIGARAELAVDIKNIYRAVRGNLYNLKSVVEAKEFFESSHFFHNMNNRELLQKVVTTFLRAYGVGLITTTEDGWYVKYDEDTYLNPPLRFFDNTKRTLEALDEPLEYYLVISAFSKLFTEAFNMVISGVLRLCEVDQRNSYVYPVEIDGVVERMLGMGNITLFRNANEVTRNNEILYAYNETKYRDYYSYPTFYTAPETIIENVKAVIDAVQYAKRYTFRLGDKSKMARQTAETHIPVSDPRSEGGCTCSCGAVNPKDARFCKSCGQMLNHEPASIVCSKCGTSNPKDARFCQGCGQMLNQAPASWFCTNCGAKNEGQFCMSCGTPKN